MRKPRDFDAELKALDDKARRLKERKLIQLGELVIATKADALPVETLAGALLGISAADAATKEGCRKRGAAFFRDGATPRAHPHPDARGAAAGDSGAGPAPAPDRAA